MFNNRGRRRKFHTNSNRPFRRRHNGDGHRDKSPNSIMNGQFGKNSFRGIHNTEKLVEKYNILAKEALSAGDRILAENYFQHADHFFRINSTNATPNSSLSTDKNSNLKEVKISTQDEVTQPDNNTSDNLEKDKTK